MKFEVRRTGIVVIPENDQDGAYIEDTLGLKRDGSAVLLKRKNAMGLGSIAFLETEPFKDFTGATEGDPLGVIVKGGREKPAPYPIDASEE